MQSKKQARLKLADQEYKHHHFSSFPSFFDQEIPPIIWCYTGGGHLYEENFSVIKELIKGPTPVWLIFSEAGALIANRYGLFWDLVQSCTNKENLRLIFESVKVLKFNIKNLLDKNSFSYDIIPEDPAYSSAISLANRNLKCIIASPLSANTAAKLAHGISDNFISNLLAAGSKAGKRIVIVPTDAVSGSIQSKLPVRQKLSSNTIQVDPRVCRFQALKKSHTEEVIFLPQFCVGCEMCVKKYPQFFSGRESIEIRIRKIDYHNVEILRNEFDVLQKPSEILGFIEKY
ncbi:MAG: flavoprotein [Candidatus Hermodarchaeota archaeon]